MAPSPSAGSNKRAWLKSQGFIIGARDSRLNTGYPGAFMVVEEALPADGMPTRDGSEGPWCIVGDDLDALVSEAYAIFNNGLDYRP